MTQTKHVSSGSSPASQSERQATHIVTITPPNLATYTPVLLSRRPSSQRRFFVNSEPSNMFSVKQSSSIRTGLIKKLFHDANDQQRQSPLDDELERACSDDEDKGSQDHHALNISGISETFIESDSENDISNNLSTLNLSNYDDF